MEWFPAMMILFRLLLGHTIPLGQYPFANRSFPLLFSVEVVPIQVKQPAPYRLIFKKSLLKPVIGVP